MSDSIYAMANGTAVDSVLDRTLKDKGSVRVMKNEAEKMRKAGKITQAEYNNSAVAGFTTSLKTRPMIIAKMEEFVRNKIVTIYSSRLFNEFKTFIWVNGRPQAMRSYHDDLVMSFAIGCWVRDTVFTENEKALNYQKAMINSMFKANTSMSTAIPGMRGYDAPHQDSRKAKEEVDKLKEFIWLLKG